MVGYRELDRIGATLAPIMIRRRKAEVLIADGRVSVNGAVAEVVKPT